MTPCRLSVTRSYIPYLEVALAISNYDFVQNAGRNQNLLSADEPSENVTKSKYLETTIAIKIKIMKKLRAD